MKLAVLMGSPRKNGNTWAVLEPMLEEWKDLEHHVDVLWLYDMEILGCVACRTCQKDWRAFGCAYKDDMQRVFDVVRASDVILLATPIYCWYCTAPMKAALDRLMYGMNKYYGDEKGPSLWAGKHVAIVTTCGYKPEKGADLFEDGIKRYCKHSSLVYHGMFSERDFGYKSVFMDDEKEERARMFAKLLAKTICPSDKPSKGDTSNDLPN